MGFFLALQFLTTIVLPFKLKTAKGQLAKATVYFPLIGLLLGLILAAVNQFLVFMALGQFLRAVILVISLTILSGGLHLDGLADTFDACLSRKNKSEMLQVMRDSYIGAMGMISLACIILLKVALLFALPAATLNSALISMCLLSRYTLVLAIFLFPYARQEGKAKIFFTAMNWRIFLGATGISLFSAWVILKLEGLLIFFALVLLVIFLGKFITKKIGGLTGDNLGAISELSEVFMLFNILMLGNLGR